MATINRLERNLEELENLSYTQFLDISQFFAPDKECVKLLLKQYYPQLRIEDIEDIVDDAQQGLDKIEQEKIRAEEEFERLEDEREAQEGTDENDTEAKKQQRKAKREQIIQEFKTKLELKKQEQIEQLRLRKKIYEDRVREYIEEVKRIKRELRATVHKLFAEFFNLAQKLVTGLVKSVQTIVAVVVIIAAPPWNIPNAICLLVSVVEFFLDIIKQLKVAVTALDPLRKLGLVISLDKLDTVIGLLNPPIEFILALFNPFGKFDILVTKLMDKLLQLVSDEEKKKRAFKKATRKLRKYGYCQDGNFNAVDDKDKEEVQQILETYKVGPCSQAGFSINNCNVCVTGYRDDDAADSDTPTDQRQGERLDAGPFSPSSSGDFTQIKDKNGNASDIASQLSIFREFSDIAGKINQIRSEAEADGSFVYDVLLPDGSILANQTQESLDRLRRDYELLFTNLE
jgi:hypothetical protein